MRRVLLVIAMVVAFPLAATAATDLGDGACQQSDGQTGQWRTWHVADDEACLTAAEYQELFSVDNLVDAGVLENVQGDQATVVSMGVTITVETDPLDRPAEATEGTDEARTVRDVFARAAFGVHPV